jgi:sulfatase maturation enzyme AslB (radical SAM superfamily)
VQTNLTLVTERHLPLLKKHFSIGFSYDVANELRVTASGRPTDALVARKVEWARKVGLDLNGIAVISRANAAQPEQVAGYFLSRDIGFRALNIYQSLDLLPQIRDAAIPFADYVDFCRRLYAIPEVKRNVLEGRLPVDPLTTAYEQLQIHQRLKRKDTSVRACIAREWALGVNTNGDTYGIGDLYRPQYRYGSIFTQPLQELLDSDGRARRMARSRERLARVCDSCFLYEKGVPEPTSRMRRRRASGTTNRPAAARSRSWRRP